MVEPLWKTFWQFPKKLNMQFPYDPSITPLVIYFRKTQTIFQQKPAALCLQLYLQWPKTVNNTDGFKRCMVKHPVLHPHMCYYWARKGSKLLPHSHSRTCMNPEIYVEWKKPMVSHCDSFYVTFLKWQSYRNGEHVRGCPGLRREWVWT